MTVEAAISERNQSGSVALGTGRQASRRDSLEAIGLLVGVLVIILFVTLVIGVAPPGA